MIGTAETVLPNGLRPMDMVNELGSANARPSEARRNNAARAMRARRQRMSPQAAWEMEKEFFNSEKTKFRLNGTLAKAMGYNSLADATRAAQRAARAIRNSKRPPCGHIRAKIGLLELAK